MHHSSAHPHLHAPHHSHPYYAEFGRTYRRRGPRFLPFLLLVGGGAWFFSHSHAKREKEWEREREVEELRRRLGEQEQQKEGGAMAVMDQRQRRGWGKWREEQGMAPRSSAGEEKRV